MLGLIAAVVLLGYAGSMLFGDGTEPMPLQIAVLVTALLEATLCYLAYRRIRVAWSFAVSLNGTLAVVLFFGATNVRDGLGVSLTFGFMPSLAFALITVLLALGPEDY